MPSSRRNSGNQTGGPLSPYPPINRNHSACTLTGAGYGSGTALNPNSSNLTAPNVGPLPMSCNTLTVTGQCQLGANLHPGMAQIGGMTSGASLSTGHLTVTRHGSFSGAGGLSDNQVHLQTSMQTGVELVPSALSANADHLMAVRSSLAVNQDHGNSSSYLSDVNNNQLRRKSSTALTSIARNSRVLCNFRANSEPTDGETGSLTDMQQSTVNAATVGHPPQPRPSSVMSGQVSGIKNGGNVEISRCNSSTIARTNRLGPRLSTGAQNSTASDLGMRRRPKPLSISANSCSSSDDMDSDDEQRAGSAGLGSGSSADVCGSGKIAGEIKLSFVMTKGLLEIEIIGARGLALNQNKTPPGQCTRNRTRLIRRLIE
jgi:hypothetical protein